MGKVLAPLETAFRRQMRTAVSPEALRKGCGGSWVLGTWWGVGEGRGRVTRWMTSNQTETKKGEIRYCRKAV